MNASELIARHEGTRAKPYVDTVGKVTIGIGRNLTDIGLSQDEINYLFNNDRIRALDKCSQYPWFSGLSEPRKAACLDLVFNLGSLHGFPKFCAAMEAHDYGAAANELIDSAWYKQVGVRGPEVVELIRNERWPA